MFNQIRDFWYRVNHFTCAGCQREFSNKNVKYLDWWIGASGYDNGIFHKYCIFCHEKLEKEYYFNYNLKKRQENAREKAILIKDTLEELKNDPSFINQIKEIICLDKQEQKTDPKP